MGKKQRRLRRARRTRAQVRKLGSHRLTVYRSPRHIYAQIIAPDESKVVASASTVEKAVKADGSYGGNVKAAEWLGDRAEGKAVERLDVDVMRKSELLSNMASRIPHLHQGVTLADRAECDVHPITRHRVLDLRLHSGTILAFPW